MTVRLCLMPSARPQLPLPTVHLSPIHKSRMLTRDQKNEKAREGEAGHGCCSLGTERLQRRVLGSKRNAACGLVIFESEVSTRRVTRSKSSQ